MPCSDEPRHERTNIVSGLLLGVAIVGQIHQRKLVARINLVIAPLAEECGGL
jgi:hypothetical protein